ncbi:hypothetical protein [Corynebacterium lehmanniae]
MYERLREFIGGFVITERELEAVRDFEPIDLPSSVTLWREKSCKYASWAEGDFLIGIHGHWAWTKGEVNPPEMLRLFGQTWLDKREDFEAALEHLAGRYMLFVCYGDSTYVYHDAMGNRTVYYSEETRTVASHLKLIAEADDREYQRLPGSFKALRWAADYTPFRNLKILLPNFRLRIEDLEIDRYYPLRENRYTDLPREDRLELIETKFANIFDSYVRDGWQFAISISGGFDSRFILAMMKDYWPDSVSYTYGLDGHRKRNRTKYFQDTMRNDFATVRELTKDLPLKERVMIDRDQSNSPDVDKKFQATIKQNTVGSHGYALVPRYAEIFAGQRWLSVRGNAVEIVRKVSLPDLTFDQLSSRSRKNIGFDPTDRLRELGYERAPKAFSRAGLTHWELQNGKWLSEIQNEQDVAFETLVPMASRDVLELMDSFEPHEKLDNLVVKELIQRKVPSFNEVSANGAPTLFEEWKALKTESNKSAILFSDVSVVDTVTGEASATLGASISPLQMPGAHFSPHFELVAELRPVETEGDRWLTVESPYKNIRGRGFFRWRIEVNERICFETDGATGPSKVAVAISGIRATDSVKVVISPLKSVTHKLSWERASELRVTDQIIQRPLPDGERLTVEVLLSDQLHRISEAGKYE